jgi:predicted Zn-dependent protease with MMP-like domain
VRLLSAGPGDLASPVRAQAPQADEGEDRGHVRASSAKGNARDTTRFEMTRRQFEELVRMAVDTLPRRFRKHLQNVAVVVEDQPSPELLREMNVPPGDTLFGLYQGTPLTERRWDFGNVLPDRITIFRQPIEEESEGNEDEVVTAVGETVIHEVGHYFGLSEEEIEAIEEQYWRGQE